MSEQQGGRTGERANRLSQVFSGKVAELFLTVGDFP